MLHYLAMRAPPKPPPFRGDRRSARRLSREAARARFVLLCGSDWLANMIEESDPDFPWEDYQ